MSPKGKMQELKKKKISLAIKLKTIIETMEKKGFEVKINNLLTDSNTTLE
jgi:hypothetical protein